MATRVEVRPEALSPHFSGSAHQLRLRAVSWQPAPSFDIACGVWQGYTGRAGDGVFKNEKGKL